MARGFKTGGRVVGSVNRENRDIRLMILGALDQVGGQDYLARQAIENPGPFMTLIGKVLPTQITGDGSTPNALHLLAAQLVSEHLLQTQLTPPPIIDMTAERTSTNLLDAPPPTE
jgi:hypothetical protein